VPWLDSGQRSVDVGSSVADSKNAARPPQQTLQPVSDVSREQATTAADLAQKNAEANFTGKITERGQNFQKEEAANSLASGERLGQLSADVTQRQQDISNVNAKRALDIEAAQVGAQQRSTALAGLEAALKVIPPDAMY
jgi:hypothetical protein